MTELVFRPVALSTPADEFEGRKALLHGREGVVIAELSARPGRVYGELEDSVSVLQWRDFGKAPRKVNRRLPRFATLESIGVAQGLVPLRAVELPPINWPLFGAPRILVGRRSLTVAEVVATLPPLDSARAVAQARVADVRAVYGRMLADVAYRIENAALFDSSVPTTRQFETALALWSDVTASTPDPEVTRRAGMVSVTFDAARAHAETVGLAHLPAQSRAAAGRAAGAARLARDTRAAESERAAAQEQVIRILRSLALHYLPEVDRGQVTG